MTAIHLLVMVSGLLAADEVDTPRDKAVVLEDYTPCGLTSLYLVCQLREVPVTWERVKDLVGAPGPGGDLSFADLAAAATRLGMHPVGIEAGRSTLDDMPMPAVVQVRDRRHPEEPSHFLVLLRTEADGVWLLDAPYPAYFLPDSRFRNAWTGNVLLFAHDEAEARQIRELARRQEATNWIVWAGVAALALVLPVWFAVKPMRSRWRAAEAATIRVRFWNGLRRPRLRTAAACVLLLTAALGVFFVVRLVNGAPPQCELDEPVLELGELSLGPHTIQVPVRNGGGQALRISEIASTCSCAVVKAPTLIEPGQTATLQVELRVSPGPRSAELRVKTNDAAGTKHVTINWHGKVRPILIPRWIASSHAAADQIYEKTVRLIYPGGKSAIVPRLERVESEGAFVEVSEGKNDPGALKFASAGLLTNILGELELKVRVKPPEVPGTVRALARVFLVYGKSTEVLDLPISINFFGGRLTPDASAVTFVATQDSSLFSQERLVRVRGAWAKDEVEVSGVPAWLSCHVDQDVGEECVLRLKMTGPTPASFFQHELGIGSRKDPAAKMPLRVTVLAPGPKSARVEE